jgi:hypothetical protein
MVFDSQVVGTQVAGYLHGEGFRGGPMLPAPVRQRFVNHSLRLQPESCLGKRSRTMDSNSSSRCFGGTAPSFVPQNLSTRDLCSFGMLVCTVTPPV